MTGNSEIREDNREKAGDKHEWTESRSRDQKNFAPVRHWIVGSYRTVAGVTLNTLILVGCLELAAMGMSEIRGLSSISAEQIVGEGTPREKTLIMLLKVGQHSIGMSSG